MLEQHKRYLAEAADLVNQVYSDLLNCDKLEEGDHMQIAALIDIADELYEISN